MAGTIDGGKRASMTNKSKYDAEYMAKYGMTFYAYIGSLGGAKGRGGGFASDIVGPDGLTGRERARIAGVKGGKISKRSKKI